MVEKLIKRIEEQIEKNRDYKIEFNDELMLFQYFFEEYSRNDITSICNVEVEYMLALILFAHNINMSYDEVIKKIPIFTAVINNIDDWSLFDIYVDLIEQFVNNGQLEEMFEYVEKYGDFKSIKKLNNHKDMADAFEAFILLSLQFFPKVSKGLGHNIKIDDEKMQKFISVYQSVGSKEPFEQFTSISFAKKMFSDSEIPEFLETVKKKDKKRALRFLVKQINPRIYQEITACLDKITNHYNQLVTRKNNEEKAALKNTKCNENLLVYLNKLDDHGIIILNDKLLNLCTTPEIKMELLELINQHNLKQFKQTFEINQKYKSSSLNKLELLFTKNNFKFTRLSIENQDLLISSGDLKRISKILEFLSKNNFNFVKETNPVFVDMLLYSNIDILNNISCLITNGILTDKFIQTYPTVLVSQDLGYNNLNQEFTYEKIMQKILMLREKNINVSLLVSNNPKVLECSLEELQIQLEIINKYCFNISDKNFEPLRNPYLLDLIDNYIELGLGEYVKENPELISINKKNLIDRIIISYKLEINIFNENHRIISKVANANKFYVPEDKLKSFIINYSTNYINPKYKNILDNSKRNVISDNYNELLEILEPFKNDESAYKFGNTLISKNRILRNLETILSSDELKNDDFMTILFQSVLYKSLIINDENEIKTIYNILNELPEINLLSKMK